MVSRARLEPNAQIAEVPMCDRQGCSRVPVSEAFGGYCSAVCRMMKSIPGERPTYNFVTCQSKVGCAKPVEKGEMFCSHECALADDVMTRNAL